MRQGGNPGIQEKNVDGLPGAPQLFAELANRGETCGVERPKLKLGTRVQLPHRSHRMLRLRLVSRRQRIIATKPWKRTIGTGVIAGDHLPQVFGIKVGRECVEPIAAVFPPAVWIYRYLRAAASRQYPSMRS